MPTTFEHDYYHQHENAPEPQGYAARVGMWLALALLVFLVACVPTTPTPTPTATSTPDAECVALATRLPLFETRLAESDDTARYLMQTAVALETRCAVTPTSTPTPEGAITPTSTPPTQELCKICTQGGRECAAGFACEYCPGLGYRCVNPASVNGSCNQCRIAAATAATPILRGLATWYGNDYHVGRAMRNGEPYDPQALTCAVPAELWPELQGKMLYVQAVAAPQHGVWVRVTDTGCLTEAGRFCYLSEHGFWGSCPEGERGQPIVIDLSPAAHRALGTMETIEVEVWEPLPGMEGE